VSVYPFSEFAKWHPDVGQAVHILRCVDAGHMSGESALPSADIHSMAVVNVLLQPTPLWGS
jgi:hypothetical protein